MDAGRLGKLCTRLKSDIVRMSYIPKNELGMEEYVLVFENSIPSASQERRFYRRASRVEEHEEETSLFFDDINTEVIMLTRDEDDKFRKDYPELVLKNESFRIDDLGKGNYECRYSKGDFDPDKMDVDVKVWG